MNKELDITHVSLGWSSGTSRISKMIQRLDRLEWMGRPLPSKINHVYLKFEFCDSSLTFIYESHMKIGVRPSPYQHLLRALSQGKVVNAVEKRLDFLTPEEKREAWDRAVAVHAAGYDYPLILAYYLWLRLHRRLPDRLGETSGREDRMTCNEFGVYCLEGLAPQLDHVLVKKTLTPEALFRIFIGEPSGVFLDGVGAGRIVSVDPSSSNAIDQARGK